MDEEEIVEAMMQMLIYAGFPVALNTILTIATEVFSKRRNQLSSNLLEGE